MSKKTPRSKEQKLVDIMFQIALAMKDKPQWVQNATREEIAAWVVGNLRDCGFDTYPSGSSWGVLKENP